MATSNCEKVLSLLEGVGARDSDRATKHINPDNFVEHNPRLNDGVEGLREFIRQSTNEHWALKMVRAFEDGAYVFTQSDGMILGRNVFFDLFKFENSQIVEHWGFSTKGAPPNQSGHTQTDGPTEAKLSEDTEGNKAIVREYYETIHIAGDHEKIPQFFSGDRCIRHEPGVRDGVTAFKSDLTEITKNRSIDEIKFLFGHGDFVFIAAKGSHEKNPCVYVDLYRVEGGKIAERWGFSEAIPPQEERKNINGLL